MGKRPSRQRHPSHRSRSQRRAAGTLVRARTPVVWVRQDAPAFTALFAAARERGQRLGWLVIGTAPPPPASLDAALALGVLRAVAVGDGVQVSAKRMRGAPVLRDLVREQFSGCAAVLVRGGVVPAGEVELHARADGSFACGPAVEGSAVGQPAEGQPAGERFVCSAGELVARLARPAARRLRRRVALATIPPPRR